MLAVFSHNSLSTGLQLNNKIDNTEKTASTDDQNKTREQNIHTEATLPCKLN